MPVKLNLAQNSPAVECVRPQNAVMKIQSGGQEMAVMVG